MSSYIVGIITLLIVIVIIAIGNTIGTIDKRNALKENRMANRRPTAESDAEDRFRAAVQMFIQEHREVRLQLYEAKEGAPAAPGELERYLIEARHFSYHTFGPGKRTLGVTKHIRKELDEILAKPEDLEEWIDVIILGMDGFWRHGGQPSELMRMIKAKLEKNKARTWPAPTSEDEAVEHDRSKDPLNPELCPEHREYWIRKANDGSISKETDREK